MIKPGIVKIGPVSVYAKDLTDYITECFFLYSSIINNHVIYTNRISRNSSNSERSEITKRIQEARLENIKTLREIQDILEPHVSPKKLLAHTSYPSNDLTGSIKDLLYLKRDWSWEEESESQVQAIAVKLKEIVKNISDKHSAVFLGAGLGRFAFELNSSFDRIIAIDKSYSMAFHFEKLLNEDIMFNVIHEKNFYHKKNVIEEVTSTINPLRKSIDDAKKPFKKIEYLAADATHLPFDDNSVSVIFSIYFTDVIALKVWLSEVKRVLKKDGYFIHIGPLDYFFGDVSQMLSAEEVRQVFEQNGFETLEDSFVATSHMASQVSFSKKLYNNWVFVAKRKLIESTPSFNFTLQTVVASKSEINYTITGRISGGEEEQSFNLLMPDGEIFEGAETPIDILRTLGKGGITISQLIIELEKKYGKISNSDTESIVKVLALLLKRGLLNIVEQ